MDIFQKALIIFQQVVQWRWTWSEFYVKDIYNVVSEKISEFKNKERKYPMSDRVKWKAIKRCLKNTFFLYANNFLKGQGWILGNKLSKLLSKTNPDFEFAGNMLWLLQEAGLFFV